MEVSTQPFVCVKEPMTKFAALKIITIFSKRMDVGRSNK